MASTGAERPLDTNGQARNARVYARENISRSFHQSLTPGWGLDIIPAHPIPYNPKRRCREGRVVNRRHRISQGRRLHAVDLSGQPGGRVRGRRASELIQDAGRGRGDEPFGDRLRRASRRLRYASAPLVHAGRGGTPVRTRDSGYRPRAPLEGSVRAVPVFDRERSVDRPRRARRSAPLGLSSGCMCTRGAAR